MSNMPDTTPSADSAAGEATPSDTEPRQSVAVALGARSYDIHIGPDLLNQAAAYIAPLLTRPWAGYCRQPRRGLALIDPASVLDVAGVAHVYFVVEAGESAKNFVQLEALCDWLLAEKIERNDCIIALGGGVIGDLTGFAAAILRRGTRLTKYRPRFWRRWTAPLAARPLSTLRRQILIGAFHQPDLVLADSAVLVSLPPRELRRLCRNRQIWCSGRCRIFRWLEEN